MHPVGAALAAALTCGRGIAGGGNIPVNRASVETQGGHVDVLGAKWLGTGCGCSSGGHFATAGLAIREMMRAEIASLRQGVRNAHDAVSLIQTAGRGPGRDRREADPDEGAGHAGGHGHLQFGPTSDY